MTLLTCVEDSSLPASTLCGSTRTALELRSQFRFTRFKLQFDDSIPHDHLRVSSDLYDELSEFLLNQEHSADHSLA